MKDLRLDAKGVITLTRYMAFAIKQKLEELYVLVCTYLPYKDIGSGRNYLNSTATPLIKVRVGSLNQ